MLYNIKDLEVGKYFNFIGSNIEYIIDKIDEKTITYHGANGLHTFTGFTITNVFLSKIKLIEDLKFTDIKNEDTFYFRKSSNNKNYKIKEVENNGVYIYEIDEPAISLYIKREDFSDLTLSA